jgi:4-alpha-glucanotransferase
MRQENYAWWLSRISHHLQEFDLLRIDHFRGLESAWMIDAACETAIDGHWQRMPGDELLNRIHQDAGHLPIVAEDLGIITPEVTALRKKHGLPGMSVLQFGFDEHADNPHKLQNIKQDSVVYTGTHDNDTTKGWYQGLDKHGKNYILQTLNIPQMDQHPEQDDERTADLVVDRLIDNAMNSQASLCIIPMQDCLHLGSVARMNIPGTIDRNWQWSFKWEQIHDDFAADMRLRIETANRLINKHG